MKRLLAVAALLGVLICPSTAWATVEGDQTSLSQEEIDQALRDGVIGAADESSQNAVADGGVARVAGSSSIIVLEGADRYETAAAEALHAYPEGCKTVVVASGTAWVDALSATGLAGALGAPILFVGADHVPQATADAIAQLGAMEIIVIGSTDVIAASVEADLNALPGMSSVRRVAGADRFATQLAVYEFGQAGGYDSKNHWNGDMVLVATAWNFPDALSVSSLAYAEHAPTFLVDVDGNLPEAQEQALLNASFGTALVLGSTAVVSDETLGYMEALAYASSAATPQAIRLGGETRYETSAAIAEWCVENEYLTWENVAFASGEVPYDALAGSAAQGKDGAVLLVVSDASSLAMASLVGSHADGISTVRFFGSKAAVSGAIRMAVADALGIPFADIPGFKVYVDAGHGWNSSNNNAYDGGASSGDYQEATLTKELADMVADILRTRYGIQVFLNDDGGWYKLRHAEAIAQGCDAVVSIHFNAGGGTGTESYIHSYNASPLSALWQDRIHSNLCAAMGLANRGMLTEELAVVGGKLPATLLEICFIDNGSDMAQYQLKKMQVAEAIAEGIVR